MEDPLDQDVETKAFDFLHRRIIIMEQHMQDSLENMPSTMQTTTDVFPVGEYP